VPSDTIIARVLRQIGWALNLPLLRKFRHALAEAKLTCGEAGRNIIYIWASAYWRPQQRWRNDIRELSKTVIVIRHSPIRQVSE
jgi:hypothetical protein